MSDEARLTVCHVELVGRITIDRRSFLYAVIDLNAADGQVAIYDADSGERIVFLADGQDAAVSAIFGFCHGVLVPLG
jgi:aspartate 1-decarboxylase